VTLGQRRRAVPGALEDVLHVLVLAVPWRGYAPR
jgi:hypothetical protein